MLVKCFSLFLSFQYDSSVSYSEQYYDLPHSIVSFAFSPRSHSPPSILFARFAASLFPRGGRSSAAAFRIIHDFNNEMQYTINQRSVSRYYYYGT